MALVFLDGFDAGDYPLKWIFDNGNLSGSATTRFSTGRCVSVGGINTGGSLVKSFTAMSQVFVGLAVTSTSYTGFFLQLQGDSGATTHVGLAFTGATTLSLFRGSTSTILASGSVPSMSSGGWAYVEMSATINDTTGSCIVRCNGATVINFTGDTKNGGTNTTIDTVKLGGWTGHSFDDFYLCDSTGSAPYNTFLGDVRIYSLSPNGAGSSTQFTPSTGANYTTVDEMPYSASDYNTGTASGQRDLYTLSDIPTTSGTVYAVQQNLIAKKTDAGTISVKPTIKSGGTIYYGTTTALASSDAIYSDLRTADPATATTWTITGVNALEGGAEVV